MKGLWERALLLLDEMHRGGPGSQPNLRSYTAAIGACGRAGQWKQAVDLHEAMVSDGLSPDNASFNAVISAARCEENMSQMMRCAMLEEFVFSCVFG